MGKQKEMDFMQDLINELSMEENQLKMRNELMARYENDAKMEQLSAHKKKLKMIQHKKDVQDIMNERKRLKEMEQKKEAELDEAVKKDDKLRQEIIQKERLRLIEEHAPKLKHFLNTKLATNQE